MRFPSLSIFSNVTTEQRVKRLLILAVLFFISGLAFFILRMEDVRDTEEPIEMKTVPIVNERENPVLSRKKNMPQPSDFISFVYHTGDVEYVVEGTCKDVYYTVLIFEENVDYRTNVLNAKYNVATPCEGTTFSVAIALDSLHLSDQKKYYIVRAQQGAKDGWYNPY